MIRRALCLLLLLGACSTQTTKVESPKTDLPNMKRFVGAPDALASRSNVEVSEDFLDLAFRMEGGLELTKLSRFEGPVTLRVLGPQPPTLQADLTTLISRLRSEARIDIRQVPGTQDANITVQVVTRSQIRNALPGAACFVMPNVSTFDEFRSNRRTLGRAWPQLVERTRMAIFLPGDESPQEIRDCLNEEIAQALGPVNDLYRLPDSVFNDDNMHTVLTSFDMLILRAYYDPSLHSGMSRKQVAARVPSILNRLNPGGRGYGGVPLADSPRSWIRAVEDTLQANPGSTRGRRAAEKSLAIAQSQGWRDARLGFSLFLHGRALIGNDNDKAVAQLLASEKLYHGLGRAEVQAAHVNLHLAAIALAADQDKVAVERIDRYLPTVKGSQNALLYAKMLMLKAEALERLGRDAEARLVRLDSLGWARYGFGDDTQIRASLREIAGIGKGGSS